MDSGTGSPKDRIHSLGNVLAEAFSKRDPLRIVLLEEQGIMRELWLPASVEGRYHFPCEQSFREEPAVIKAMDGRWHVVCCNGWGILLRDRGLVKQIEIGDQDLFEIVKGENRYTIFAEAENEGARVYYPYRIDRAQKILIGRHPDCGICYSSPLISRKHAILYRQEQGWRILDNDSTNGVYLNGHAVSDAEVCVGDCIYIMGMRMIMGKGYLAICSGNGKLRITQPEMKKMESIQDIPFDPCPLYRQDDLFHRLPRRRNLLNPEDIEIEQPPATLSSGLPLLLRVGNPMISGGRAIASGNVVGAVTSMLMPMLTQGFTEKDRKEYETRRVTKYREYLATKKTDIEEEISSEQKNLSESYPDLQGVLKFAKDKNRLWERQKMDSDFLSVRIGSGSIPMKAKVIYPKKRFELEEDCLENEMYDLAERPMVVPNAPVMLSLKDDFVCGILGEREQCAALMRNMIIQLAMTHAYDELKIVLLIDEDLLPMLWFAGYLPHFWNNERSARYIATSKEEAQQLSKELIAQFEHYTDNDTRKKDAVKAGPAFVIFVQNKQIFESVEVLNDIVSCEDYCGFSVIAGFDGVPKECTKLIDVHSDGTVIDLRQPENEEISFAPDLFSADDSMEQLREVMGTRLVLPEQQAALPNMITFMDMYKAGRIEDLNPLKRWEENNPVKSIAAPIGIGTDGNLFTLDLHEKRQGPHGLVAGMTGSGKSEFIITYILSMAVNYSPDEVAFVLIDYKGGGLADAFVDPKRGIHLPHVVGTITNLDGAGIQRSLLSINSELKRRQAVFSRAKSETNEGTMDIYDYQKLYRQKRVHEPLPHLFIVSDEFAELKKQKPEFMDELISTARIGRSLGVHLILATQKPSGVVNDQIWSNTKFRVCLKVQDKGDSMEMLKRPEAAELRQTGRFYLQVGYNELFALGQSAWCGAGYVPRDEYVEEKDNSVQFVDTTGQTILSVSKQKNQNKAEAKQIVAIVKYLSDLAKRQNITPRMLWKDPLPEKLELESLLGEFQPSSGCFRVPIGMVDDPQRQRQYPLWIDFLSFHNMLLVGSGGSGKSTFLRTMLVSLIRSHSPEELTYYLVDLSGGALSAFRNMPHCGAYLGAEEENAFERLIQFFRELTAERKRLFAEKEVTSYEDYLQNAKMPLVLLVIDSYQNITSCFSKGGEYYSTLHTLLAEASGYGIRFVLTCNHSNEVSTKCKQELDYRISLHTKDRFDASDVLGVKCSVNPPKYPGRGLCVSEGESLEYQTAMLYCKETVPDAVNHLKAELSRLAQTYADAEPAKKLPSLNGEQTYPEFCRQFPPFRIPLGYSAKDMKPVSLPFQQFTCLPVYFGNPIGVRPVLRNLLYAAQREHMEVIVVKKNEDSAFDSQDNLLAEFEGKSTIYYCDDPGLNELAQRLNNEVIQRNEFINAYSDMVGIPRSERGRAKKAAGYLREHTTPLLVLFESFREFSKFRKQEGTEAVFQAFIGGLKGYNIYLVGCFYPEDQSVMRSDALLPKFIQADTFLLFGGRYHMQCLTQNLPMEYRRREKAESRFDRCILRYRDGWHEMQMPCGKLEAPDKNPDEESII